MSFLIGKGREKLENGMMAKYKPLLISVILMILFAGGWITVRLMPADRNKKAYYVDGIENFCINAICLDKENDQWMANNGETKGPADSETIDNYVKRFKKIELSEVASVNTNKFYDLGIGGTEVILKIKGKELEIGNISGGYDGTYVREKDGDTVYKINEVLPFKNLVNIEDWISKTVTNFPRLQIQKITVSEADKVTEITAKEEKWPNPDWVEKAAGLRAFSYWGEEKNLSAVRTITLETEGEKIELNLGKYMDNDKVIYWVSRGNKYYFEIGAADYNLLTGKFN